jgi:hypothetical protein
MKLKSPNVQNVMHFLISCEVKLMTIKGYFQQVMFMDSHLSHQQLCQVITTEKSGSPQLNKLFEYVTNFVNKWQSLSWYSSLVD